MKSKEIPCLKCGTIIIAKVWNTLCIECKEKKRIYENQKRKTHHSNNRAKRILNDSRRHAITGSFKDISFWYISQGLTTKEDIETAFKKDLEKFPKICQICNTLEDLCFDHCHVTGRPRGFLCQICNRLEGLIPNSVFL